MRTALRFLLAIGLAAAGLVAVQTPASAAMEPSFVVTCYPTGIAKNDPIVFPSQAGLSHMHSFFGAKGVTENTTAKSLSSATSSQCGSYYDGIDLSAYWIPTLYKNGQQVYRDDGSIQLRAYYKRAGGPDGQPVDQAWPRGLKIIAGDMHATSAQPEVLYFCANTVNTGSQGKASTEFPSCDSDETLVAKLTFPDCWDGVYLDSANHKSHMAYSSGSRNTCPADHPVKIAQLTFEAWFYGVNGKGSDFSWASGGPYSYHGDVISMWQPRPAANLVNQCINVAFDCNIFNYTDIPVGAVTQAQIDAQYKGVEPAPSTTSPSPMPTMTMEPTPTASATPTMTMEPTATVTPTMTMEPTPTASATPSATVTPSQTPTPASPSPSPSHEHSMTPTPSVSVTPTVTPTQTPTVPPTQSPTITPTPSVSPTLGVLTGSVPTIEEARSRRLALRVDEGSWGPTPVSFTYQWYRDGVAVGGATKRSYPLSAADIGTTLSVSVTGSKAGYANLTEVSEGVGPVWLPAWLFGRTGGQIPV